MTSHELSVWLTGILELSQSHQQYSWNFSFFAIFRLFLKLGILMFCIRI